MIQTRTTWKKGRQDGLPAFTAFDNSGFKDNDVITTINGTPLTSVPGTIKLLHSLKQEAKIDIEFLRNGQYQTASVAVD